MKQFFTIYEMANAINVSSATIHNWIKNNEIKTVLKGKRKYIPLTEYERIVGVNYDSSFNNSIFENKELEITFNAFYKLYPKKQCKHDAQRAWKKLNPSKELADIILSDIMLRLKLDWKNNTKIMQPTTYLNNKCWED